ncbi:MAG: lysylphosphatidylglycerol synthase domain-containing protein [Lachnospiraceae bacterium]
MKILERFIKKKDLSIPITYGQMIKVVLLFICNWLVVGVGFYMLVCFLLSPPVPTSGGSPLWPGIYGLCCIIGILAVFAPSGLGVREGIMLLGLGLVMPKEYAVIISIISRLWQTVAELILIAIAFIVNKIMEFRKKKKKTA